MDQEKLIAVVGATGAQGGGLVLAIVNDPASRFGVRALTRDTSSEKVNALTQLGVEAVTANLDDVESLKHAFAGCYGAFCLTNYWQYFSPERELARAKAMAQAAQQAGLRHVVWSTLEDTRRWVPLADQRMPTLMEKYKVPGFDALTRKRKRTWSSRNWGCRLPSSLPRSIKRILSSLAWDQRSGRPGAWP